ncbi:MAG: hypothetical protein E7054_09670 [Lentisphaerae bacterium]|nr:hypothetical protein [Lentisphaerota bacterium]
MSYNVGDTICNCTLLQKCGEGAYGEVWLARDAIGTRVALKIIKNGGRYSERELAGLKNYKDCNHPNLLKIRYVEISQDYIYCTMDAADDLNHGSGEYQPDTLANRLNKFGRLDGKEITDMLDGLLAGLEELHKHGLVHRDIKPDNILWVNGRATLADVGLIAFEGAGSLVGTPGFLSPRVLEGNPAEASDDFYALGKVIYCALTGLAVTEYPSLPIDVTISMDANLNKALRESCSHPVKSTAEFRKLLNGKSVSKPPEPKIRNPFPIKKLVMISGIVVLLGAFVYLFIQQQKMAEKHIVQPVPVDVESERKLTQLQNIDNDFQKELQSNVQNFFRKSGWLDNGKMLPYLLNYEVMDASSMRELITEGSGNPRLQSSDGAYRKTVRTSTSLEMKLFSMLHGADYPDFDVAKVQERQSYWKNRADIKSMLTTDPIMQAVALDAVIRHGINKVLEHGSFRNNEETELKELIDSRHALLDPGWGKLQFMSRNFH